MFWERDQIDKKDLLIPVSILVAALIISTSIFLSQTRTESSDRIRDLGAEEFEDNDKIVKITKRDGAHILGSGKIEIVEFSDFQCPFCQRFFNDAYKKIKSNYIDTGKAKFVYRHLPLPIHPNAPKAAEASECAGAQNKFFQYHDLLFENSNSSGAGLGISDLKKYARSLGLDTNKFDSCLDNGDMADIVKQDLKEANRLGISGTPTVFVNGKRIIGAQPYPVFETAIEEALAR